MRDGTTAKCKSHVFKFKNLRTTTNKNFILRENFVIILNPLTKFKQNWLDDAGNTCYFGVD